MDFRVLETIRELEQAVEVEIAVWGLHPLDTVPLSMMRAVTHTGGLALGAYDGAAMVGMAFAFPALHNGKVILWSHMTGVLPTYQARDIGFTLKQKQRDWALANGYDEIGWTFDPLKRGNANFNLHRLGVTASVYHINFYGQMEDAINLGTPSDRLEVIWQLNNPRVAALANGESATSHYPSPTPDLRILKSVDGAPVGISYFESPLVFAEIPSSLDLLTGDSAGAWRLALRESLQTAFSCGYSAVDFVRVDNCHFYVFQRL
jgi:predicted GNAT superfamily acetyltransferase